MGLLLFIIITTGHYLGNCRPDKGQHLKWLFSHVRKRQQHAETATAELLPLLSWCPQQGLSGPGLFFRLPLNFGGRQVPHQE